MVHSSNTVAGVVCHLGDVTSRKIFTDAKGGGNTPGTHWYSLKSWLLALAAGLCLSGCAGIRMQMPRMTPITRTSMQERFKEGIPESLNVPASDRRRFAFQAGDSVHGAAITICKRVFGPEHGCATRLARYRLTVLPNTPVVNAHIDINNHITVYGGLIRRVGSEGELAAVLAHEYAHGLMNHPRRTMRNVAVGTLVGTVAGAVIGAAAGDDSGDTAEGMRAGAECGQLAGIRAYSQVWRTKPTTWDRSFRTRPGTTQRQLPISTCGC